MHSVRRTIGAAAFVAVGVCSVGLCTVGVGTASAETPVPPPPSAFQVLVDQLSQPAGCVLPTVMGGVAGGSLGATLGAAAAGVGAPLGAAAGAAVGAGLATSGCLIDESGDRVVQGHAVADPDEVLTKHKGKGK